MGFKIGKIVLVIFVFLIFQNFWHPCTLPVSFSFAGGDVVRLTKQDNGKEITVKVGDVIQIELKRFGATGYEWYFDKPYGEYFQLIREDTKEISREGFVGTPVIRTWELKALKKGETEVILYLYRSWEGRDKAVDWFELKVNIL
jgi:inhibitor of cysteine peptidase